MNTKIMLVRHAEAEGNYYRIFQGWTDGELTKKGHIQAEKIAERFADIDIDIIFSSSLKRALRTAQYIAEKKNLHVNISEKLWEINGGDWENELWSILPEKWPVEYRTWTDEPHLHEMPNGESMTDFYQRLVSELLRILNENLGKNILIVTHGTAIRNIMCYLKGLEFKNIGSINWVENTALTIANYHDGKFEMLSEGDACHLGDELGTIMHQDWFTSSGGSESNNDKGDATCPAKK